MAKNSNKKIVDLTFVKEAYINASPLVRNTINVVIFAGVVYGSYKLIKYFGAGGKSDRAQRQEDNAWNQEIDKINQNPATRQTISKAQSLSLANKIFAAIDGVGTDEDAIMDAFRVLKNNADFAALNAAFGKRKVSSGVPFVSDVTGNLSTVLGSELDTNEVAKINLLLQTKGIRYRI
jgi:hypothetical protein